MFVPKSIIARYKSVGILIILQFYNVQKFFDKEMIEDGFLVCSKQRADPKAVRLWYKLNQDTDSLKIIHSEKKN